MKLPPHTLRNSFFIVILAVVIYALVGLWVGFEDLKTQLAGFPPSYFLGLAFLSLLNYGLRFFRWHLYLDQVRLKLPLRDSLGLYFSAYVMVITPGKVGEVFKAAIMREKFGIPLAKGLPVVLAERVYDFLAVLILAAIGLATWPASYAGLGPGLILSASVPAVLLVLHNARIRAWLLNKLGKAPLLRDQHLALDDSLSTLETLFRPVPFAGYSLLSVVAWMAECLGLWLACRGLGWGIPTPDAVFTYAAGTLVGSLSFLPGGLGGTEATIIYLLQSLGLDAATGATVALIVRLFTLWLAVVIGLGFSLGFRSRFFTAGEQKKDRG
jgi:uncharacterized membrane protein YbhN (UPF0104 family)|nr:lysylphosphatidylglycerol synthase transmembrane domain-containing protein [Candidatus Krumholzibacteria bacterium]